MADIFYEPELGQNPIIQYATLAEKLFPAEPKQRLMPFLGAGASLPARPMSDHAPTKPAQHDITSICDQLGLTKRRARLFMDLALHLASAIEIEGEPSSGAIIDKQTVFRKAVESRFPPSANELAEVLALLSEYDTFERPRRKLRTLLRADDSDLVQMIRRIAVLTEIAQPTAPLLAVSSYYEYTNRRPELWEKLHDLFVKKTSPTPTNFLVARAAHWHLSPERRPRKNYLIITTNYDRLMEIALERFRVPHCVLTVDREDRHVDVRFSADVQKYLGFNDGEFRDLQNELNGTRFPANFTLEMSRPLVVLFKIHGCLFPIRQGGDSIILSDEDYIDYLSHMSDNAGMIPSAVSELMADKSFLFVGYSFSDWNVRGIYKKLVEKRGGAGPLNNSTSHMTGAPRSTASPVKKSPIQDYAVVRNLNVYESAFFREKTISLLQTDLDQFSRKIRAEARRWMKNAAQGTRA